MSLLPDIVLSEDGGLEIRALALLDSLIMNQQALSQLDLLYAVCSRMCSLTYKMRPSAGLRALDSNTKARLRRNQT